MASALKIKATKAGFRRAGFGFSNTSETILPIADLTKEQVETLKAEPNLLVSEIEITAVSAKKDGDGFDREAAFAYLASQGITPPANTGDKKLKEKVEEAKAAEAEAAAAETEKGNDNQ